MANVKKGQSVPAPQRWDHLRDWKRFFWKRQRGADREAIHKEKQEELVFLAALPDNAIDTSDAPELSNWSDAKRGRP